MFREWQLRIFPSGWKLKESINFVSSYDLTGLDWKSPSVSLPVSVQVLDLAFKVLSLNWSFKINVQFKPIVICLRQNQIKKNK